jgi:predicted DNA-binding transcriptional regulator AlpA
MEAQVPDTVPTNPANEPLLVRTTQAPAFVGLPPTTFYMAARRPDFPRKVVIGPQSTGYLRSELRAWVAAQKREVPV